MWYGKKDIEVADEKNSKLKINEVMLNVHFKRK
jgi:hypothetical protein